MTQSKIQVPNPISPTGMSYLELNQYLEYMASAPKNTAQVEHICIRPKPGDRQVLDRVELSPTKGVVGDRWKTSAWLRLPNGAPDPRVQVALCSPRLLSILSCDANSSVVIGDTFVADLDFSEANLPVGQQLSIGTAIIEVSDVVNDACKKFAHRFGADAFYWIRDSKNRHLRLRGIFAQVIQGGEVWVDAPIAKE